MSPFRKCYDKAWTELQRSDSSLDQASTKTALADLIITFASHGESDPQKIKALALAAFEPHHETEPRERCG